MASVKLTPFLEFDLPDYKTCKFSTFAQFKTWVEIEQENWKPLQSNINFGRVHPVAVHAISIHQSLVQDFKNTLYDLEAIIKNSPEIRKIETNKAIEAINNSLAKHNNYICSTSDIGNDLVRIINEDNDESVISVGYILAGIYKIDNLNFSMKVGNQNNLPAAHRIFDTVNYLIKANSNTSSVHSTLKAQLNRNETDIAKALKGYLDTEKALDTEFKSITRQSEEAYAIARKRIYTATRRLIKREQQLNKRLEAIEVAFKEKMRLEAAVGYWETRKTDSNKLSNRGALMLAGGIIVALAITFWLGVDYIDYLTNYGKTPLGLSGILFFTLPALAVAWLLKIPARMYVENLHKVNDAEFRMALIQTYLSLLYENPESIGEEERMLILHAIFRPQNQTVVDDAPPSGLMEIIRQNRLPGG